MTMEQQTIALARLGDGRDAADDALMHEHTGSAP